MFKLGTITDGISRNFEVRARHDGRQLDWNTLNYSISGKSRLEI